MRPLRRPHVVVTPHKLCLGVKWRTGRQKLQQQQPIDQDRDDERRAGERRPAHCSRRERRSMRSDLVQRAASSGLQRDLLRVAVAVAFDLRAMMSSGRRMLVALSLAVAPAGGFAPRGATELYSASKSAAEMICNSYYNTYGVPLVVMNVMNAFGERQHPRAEQRAHRRRQRAVRLSKRVRARLVLLQPLRRLLARLRRRVRVHDVTPFAETALPQLAPVFLFLLARNLVANRFGMFMLLTGVSGNLISSAVVSLSDATGDDCEGAANETAGAVVEDDEVPQSVVDTLFAIYLFSVACGVVMAQMTLPAQEDMFSQREEYHLAVDDGKPNHPSLWTTVKMLKQWCHEGEAKAPVVETPCAFNAASTALRLR